MAHSRHKKQGKDNTRATQSYKRGDPKTAKDRQKAIAEPQQEKDGTAAAHRQQLRRHTKTNKMYHSINTRTL
ncbi:hypothetical protein [Prevotella corporis]|uniref:hypothetical protein n=1 Tax=Prevotella corporis TaxID=28128 RepID=UPI0023F7934F|nr:hypothetical protein [Prevotella corporis]